MPGFGSGPFGSDPFGQWSWSRNVLYESAPEVYRNAQAVENGFLRAYTAGQQPSFDRAKASVAGLDSLRDPFEARTATSAPDLLVLGKIVPPSSTTEQAGTLGVVTSSGTFTANDRTALFRSTDIGKLLFIRRSGVAANNQQSFTVTSIIGTKALYTDPPVSVDAGPIRWELRATDALPPGQVEIEVRGGDPRQIEPGWTVNDGSKLYEVVSRQMFPQPVTETRLLLEREGDDGYVALTPARLSLAGLTTAAGAPYLPQINTVLEAKTAGVAGNSLKLRFMPGGTGVGSLVQGDPAADPDLWVYLFESGVTTPANFEAVVSGLASCPFQVQTPSTYAGVLTAPQSVFSPVRFSGGGLQALSSASYQFQQQDKGKLVGFSGASVAANNGVWEIARVLEGTAVFGVLGISGMAATIGATANGTVLYAYQETADRLVTVTHQYDRAPGLPLVLSYSESLPGRFDVLLRLATDAAGDITTTPYDIADALAADGVVSRYLFATRPYGVGAEEPVWESAATPVKPAYVWPDGPFYWGLRSFARLVLQGTPLGVLEVDGTDLSVPKRADQPATGLASGMTLVGSGSAPWKQGDAGKLLTIQGSRHGNDGTYVIDSVGVGGVTVIVQATLNVDEEDSGGVYFALRSNPQFVTDPTRLNPLPEEVEANAEALLDTLARDFGIQVDTQQTQDRQRSWVRQVSQWVAVKGTAESIQGVASLCGFQATANDLFSLKAHPSMGIQGTPVPFPVYFVADSGRYTTLGSLTRVAGFPIYTAPAAIFVAGDVGKVLKIGGSGRPSSTTNSNYYVIAEVASTTQVRLLEPSVGPPLDLGLPVTLPDPHNGALTAAVGQLFTTSAPTFPRMDDCNFDLLADMYDLAGYPLNLRPGLDLPCDVAPIRIGYDFNGYAKATLDCATVGTGAYDSVIRAHMAGTDGDQLSFRLTAGAAFSVNKLFPLTAMEIVYQPGVTTVGDVDAAFAGLTVTNATNSGVDNSILITTASPHGMHPGDTAVLAGVTGTVEANGLWEIVYVSATSFRLAGSTFLHAYVSGGTVRNPRLNGLLDLDTAGTGATVLGAPDAFGATYLTGGAGDSPPTVVSLDPATGLLITAVSTAGFTHTVTVQGEDLRAISYPAKDISGIVSSGGYCQITTAHPHGLALGRTVVVAGVTGTVEANGTWLVTSVVSDFAVVISAPFLNPYLGGGTVLDTLADKGEWFFVDDTGVVFYMDGLPTYVSGPGPWIWTVQTTATQAPSLGNTYFQYICPLTISCDYCPTYKVRVALTADQVTQEGSEAQEGAFERTAARVDEVVPAHAEVVYDFSVPFATSALLAYASGGYSTAP